MTEYLKDINGKISIKRIWANRLIWIGVAMNIVYFILWCHAYYSEKKLLEYPTEMIWGMLGSGLGAIGLTVVEQKTNIT
jgi:hypothetical protein